MLYFNRTIEGEISELLTRPDKPVVLVRGARRVGKSCTIDHVCRGLAGKDLVTLDFQTDLQTISGIFNVPTNQVDEIMRRVAEYARTPVDKDRTILFLDEVQLDERALNSLRFFAGSGWRVIASGSLLGIAAKKRTLPFPSGVTQVTMRPLDFGEFLSATGNAAMAADIRSHVRSGEPYLLHERALDLYHRYLVVGGMPLAVRTYVETRSFERVSEVQREIDETYTSDMADPASGISGVSAIRVWDSLPKQLLRSSTKKFKYSEVVRGGRRERLLEPLEWLKAAGVCTINDLTCDTRIPLAPFNDEEGTYFKVYVADTGLMFRKFDLAAELLLAPEKRALLSSDFRGALAENFVSQQLVAQGRRTFYWMRNDKVGNGEIDFVFQTPDGRIVPVEVKSGRNVTARSLAAFMRESGCTSCYRLSEENFSLTGHDGYVVRGVPLYAAFALE